MERNRIKKIFAIAFTAVSIGAVIVANNRKSGDFQTTVIDKSFVQTPKLAMAKASMRAENSFADTMVVKSRKEMHIYGNYFSINWYTTIINSYNW